MNDTMFDHNKSSYIHASQNKTFFRNNQIIIGSPIVTQEITMDEIFNMIGLNSKRGRK